MTTPHTLWTLSYPYDHLRPVTEARNQLSALKQDPGSAIVWFPRGGDRTWAHCVHGRPGGVALIVVLPDSRTLEDAPLLIDAIHRARPRGLLPSQSIPTPQEAAALLRCPPYDLAGDVTDYLAWRGVRLDPAGSALVRRIVDLSERVTTVTEIGRAMFVSRRALGRRLATRGLPAPSHWLQLARLMRLACQLQTRDESLFRVAYGLGYPDGFSASNQMLRVVGVRPSEVRERLGWEWLLEAWLQRQKASGHLTCPGALSGSDATATRHGKLNRERRHKTA